MKVFNLAGILLGTILCSKGIANPEVSENTAAPISIKEPPIRTMNPYTPFAVKDGINLWLSGEALYMKATEDGLEYAFQDAQHVPLTPRGPVLYIPYDWSWGFRAAAGYYFTHDGWDLYFRWTWFRSHGKVHKNATLYPSAILPSGMVRGASDISAKIRLLINLTELEMGREFYVSRWLSFHPYFGITAGWIHRNIHNNVNQIVGFPTLELDVDTKCKFDGAGLTARLDTDAGLGKGWSIFNDLAFSLLYGRQKLFHEDALFTNGVAKLGGLNTAKWNTLRSIADIALGLRWDHLFCRDHYRVLFQVAWESIMFFDFNQNNVPTTFADLGLISPRSGDLGVTGVTGQLRFDF